MVMRRVDGFLDPIIIPMIVIVVCAIGFVTIKLIAKGAESPTEQAVEQVLEEVIEYEGKQVLTKE